MDTTENETTNDITLFRFGSGSMCFLLFLVFLVLKLTETVAWSWWIVTLPLWIGPAIGLGIFGIVIACLLVALVVMGIVAGAIWLFDH